MRSGVLEIDRFGRRRIPPSSESAGFPKVHGHDVDILARLCRACLRRISRSKWRPRRPRRLNFATGKITSLGASRNHLPASTDVFISASICSPIGRRFVKGMSPIVSMVCHLLIDRYQCLMNVDVRVRHRQVFSSELIVKVCK